MKKTSQRSLLFRQNVGRTEEEWAHFLDGYRQCAFTSAGFWAGGKLWGQTPRNADFPGRLRLFPHRKHGKGGEGR